VLRTIAMVDGLSIAPPIAWECPGRRPAARGWEPARARQRTGREQDQPGEEDAGGGARNLSPAEARQNEPGLARTSVGRRRWSTARPDSCRVKGTADGRQGDVDDGWRPRPTISRLTEQIAKD